MGETRTRRDGGVDQRYGERAGSWSSLHLRKWGSGGRGGGGAGCLIVVLIIGAVVYSATKKGSSSSAADGAVSASSTVTTWCGDPDHPPKTKRTRASWTAYACKPQGDAGTSCFGFADYADSLDNGCPGVEVCCPSQ